MRNGDGVVDVHFDAGRLGALVSLAAEGGDGGESWQAVVNQWIDAGNTIIAIGEYRGTCAGRSMKTAFVSAP